jgi:hypothetical protein
MHKIEMCIDQLQKRIEASVKVALMGWPVRKAKPRESKMSPLLFLLAGSLASALAAPPALSQAPISGTQWTPTRESMHDLIGQGYVLIAVDGQTLGPGGTVSIFYLSSKIDLVRCSEAHQFSPTPGGTVFPCERLVAPIPSPGAPK